MVIVVSGQDTSYLCHFVPWTLRTFSRYEVTLDTSYLGYFVPSYKTLRTFSRVTSYLLTRHFLPSYSIKLLRNTHFNKVKVRSDSAEGTKWLSWWSLRTPPTVRSDQFGYGTKCPEGTKCPGYEVSDIHYHFIWLLLISNCLLVNHLMNNVILIII